MQETEDGGGYIIVPSISIVEATYLQEKNRIPSGALAQLRRALRIPNGAFKVQPLSAEIAFRLGDIPRDSVPDLPDRIIAATALAMGLPLITRDRKIRASTIESIW
jgi:PIN domain nuclease of toxin-antitoxin system